MVDPNCLYLYLVFLTKQVCIFAWVLGQNYIISAVLAALNITNEGRINSLPMQPCRRLSMILPRYSTKLHLLSECLNPTKML